MERCSNALQAEWFYIRAASLVVPEAVDPSVYTEAIRSCDKVRFRCCSSFVLIQN
jgi:hypothetical protein